jgi:hypothetical protein
MQPTGAAWSSLPECQGLTAGVGARSNSIGRTNAPQPENLMSRWLTVGCLLIGCSPAASAPSPEECPDEIATAPEFDGRSAFRLPGRYQVTMVSTSYGTTRRRSFANVLLGPPDTLRRYFPERLHDPRALWGQQIAGVWTQQGESGVYEDLVTFENDMLYLGCRMCLDASPTYFSIEHMAATGFWGHWEDRQTGLYQVYDTAGRALPNPAGIYCAVRVSGSRRSATNAAPSAGGL